MVIDDLLARARKAGLLVELDGDHVLIQGPIALAPLARALRAREEEVRALLAREGRTPASASSCPPGAPENAGSAGTGTRATPGARTTVDADTRPVNRVADRDPPAEDSPALAAAKAELRALLQRADRVEAAARARGETVPDPDDPAVDYGAWYERQPDPPPPDAGPWPKQTVVVDVDDDGRIVSGPLCDAEGREVAP
jgi:hypothetical protein